MPRRVELSKQTLLGRAFMSGSCLVLGLWGFRVYVGVKKGYKLEGPFALRLWIIMKYVPDYNHD